MLPHGEFVEIHQELTPEQKFTLTQHSQPEPLAIPDTDAGGVRNPAGIKGKIRARMSMASAEQVIAPSESEAKAIDGGHH
jgi:ubiquinol-cytochrome c reductase cytochrome b subunit